MAETVFNEGSINGTDFRIESDDNANIFFVDGANDRIGIGTASPTSIFDVQASSGASLLYEDAGEGLLSLIYSSGTALIRLEARSGENNYINNGGQLGIGTASPTTTLNISKATTSTDGTVYPSLKVENTSAGTGNSYANIVLHGGNGTTQFSILNDGRASNSAVTLRTDSDSPINFLTNGSTALVLDTSQNATFSGNITQSKSGNLRITQTAGGSGESSLVLTANNSTGDSFVRWETNSTTFCLGLDNSDGDKFILSAGSDPHSNSVINIQPDGSSIAIDKITSVGQGFVFTGTALSSGHTGIGASGSGGDLRIYTNGTESWNFDSNGHCVSKVQSNGKAHNLKFIGSATYADDAYTAHTMPASGSMILVTNHTGDLGALFYADYGSGTVSKISDPSNTFAVADTDGKITVTKSAGSFSVTVKNRLGGSRGIGVAFIGMHES